MGLRQLCRSFALLVMLAGAAVGCAPTTPPTATPGSAPTVAVALPGAAGSGGTTIEITMPPPAPAADQVLVTPQPILLSEITPYTDPAGRFGVSVPNDWQPAEQPLSGSSDVKMGVVFQAPQANGLLTVTQFDNGQTPVSFGATANGVMKLTGLTERPGYLELAREQVMDRPDSAVRVEVLYRRNNGIPMHSLILFQLDGTVFSMVHAGVEEGSWSKNEGVIREMLRSYSAGGIVQPAAPTPEH